MNYDLKTDIATRIAKKSYLLKESLANRSYSSSESIILSAILSGLEMQYKTLSTKELIEKFEREYIKFLCNSYSDEDLLNYLIDLEREEAFSIEEDKDNDDYFAFARGEIGI